MAAYGGGNSDRSWIKNCYNTGRIDGKASYAGGILALDSTGGGVVEHCYNTGEVVNDAGVSGAIYGGTQGNASHILKPPTMKNTLYLAGSAPFGAIHSNGTGSVGDADMAGCFEARTDAQLKTAATYAGWDDSVWTIADGAYPTLK